MTDPTTTEALMTDPTTPEGAAYWQERHDYERRLEEATATAAQARRAHPPHHDVEGCGDCTRIRRLAALERDAADYDDLEWAAR